MLTPSAAVGAVARLQDCLHFVHHEIALEAGDLLIIDNHRVAHGRSHFMDTAGGPKRHLLRSYADPL